MAEIEVRNLWKIFGPRPQEALRLLESGTSREELRERTGHAVGLQDISLTIERGEIFVIMGLSGSGKSTLVRCFNRLIEPTRGDVLIGGVSVTGLDERGLRELRSKRVSMVFQRFSLLPHMSVLENVAYGLRVQNVPRAQREAEARKWLEAAGLAGWEQAMPGQLSGGMQQRVGIARALATNPDILLMDEPFSALDPLIRREMQEEMLRLQSTLHKTIVFITHDLDEALRLGDRIAILKDGRLVQLGTPEEIVARPANAYVADFTRDVNRARVIRARSVMVDYRAVVTRRDGPRAALQRMQELAVNSVFVVDGNGRFEGLVTVDDTVEALRRGDATLAELVRQDVPSAGPDATLEELLPLSAVSRWPIAIVDKRGNLLGMVVRSSLLAALAGVDTAAGDPALPAAASG